METKEKNKGGRPPKYTKAIIEKLADDLLEWLALDKPENIFLKEFAAINGLHSQYLTEFAKRSKKFDDALKRAKELQEIKIVKAMTKPGAATTGWIFTSKNVIGFRDRQETDSDLTATELDKLREIARNQATGNK